jgi:tripartite ATP-independent transporter DctM subunit
MMEWYWIFTLICLGILIFFASGTPVAFSFGLLNIIFLYLFCGGMPALSIVTFSAFSGIANFVLVAIPMFVLMGDAITFSGMANRAFNVIEKLLGRVPARIAVLTVINAMMFGAVSGSSMACTAAVGKTMVPEMLKRGYDKVLAIGSVIGGAALDILIPPSILAVVYASLADLSAGKLLIAGTLPGVMIGLMFILYVIVRAMINPNLAPPYIPEKVKTIEKIRSSIHILPLAFIFMLTMGLIYLGVATASEAAALGAGGAFLLAGLTGGLKWSSVKESLTGTVRVSCMVFLIIMGSKAFGQLLAYTGVTANLARVVGNLPVDRWWILIGMQVVVTFLGCLMDPMSIMYITLPVFLPIVKMLNFDNLWFAMIMMINLELGCITPPFGLNLYVAKGIAPKEITMMDIFVSAFPFGLMHMAGMVLVMLFPDFFLCLPNKMIK